MALLLSRIITLRILAKKGEKTDSLMMSILIPRGTAAAVLASIPLQMRILGGDIVQDTINSAIILSIIITSLLVIIVERSRSLKEVRP
jgi:potassium/hydrogen antiporter